VTSQIIHSARKDMTPQHFGLLLGFNLVFACSLAATKIGMETMPPLLFTGIRFFFYALLLTPFLKWHPGRMGTLFMIAMSTGALSFGLIYTGINIAGDLSSIVVALQLGIPFTTIFAMIFLRERIGWRRWTGMGLAFAGVLVISFDPRVLAYIDGLMIGLLGALIGSGATILMRKSKDIGVFEMQVWIAKFSWPVLLLMSFATDGNPIPLVLAADWSAWMAIAFTVLGSNMVAHAGMYWLLQRYEASFLSPFGVLGTIFTVLIGVFFLGDQMTTRMIVGTVITLGGVLIIAVRQGQSRNSRVQASIGPLAQVNPDLLSKEQTEPVKKGTPHAHEEPPIAKL
jgi:O-acetylserine/cysteine efflux transporter